MYVSRLLGGTAAGGGHVMRWVACRALRLAGMEWMAGGR